MTGQLTTPAVPVPTVPIPRRMARLPRDRHGRVVPFFALDPQGHPDPWVTRVRVARVAYAGRLCFTCGNPLGACGTFVLEAPAVVRKQSPEPPSHRTCAEYGVTGWMSVNHPAMHRQGVEEPDPLPDPKEQVATPGPGLVALYDTEEWSQQGDRDMYGFMDPVGVTWWREGRRATYTEALDALVSGMEVLSEPAAKELDPAAAAESLEAQYWAATALLPGNMR